MKASTSKSNHTFWFPWQFGLYLIAVFFCDLTGVSDNSMVRNVVQSLSLYIPSIHSLSAVAPEISKSEFELSMAWGFSLLSPILFIKRIDWDFMDKHHKSLGGPVTAGLVGVVCGVLLIAAFLYPITPSESRRGAFIAMWFKSDLAYVWGCGVILVAGMGWSFICTGFIAMCRLVAKK